MRIHSEVPIRSFPLAKDDIGIAQTVMTMQQLIDSGARNPEVRELAVDIVRQAGIRERDAAGEVRAVFNWVKHNFRFTKDPAGKETLGTPHYLMRLKAGDCDDYVVMLGALLTSLGYPVKIVTIAADPHEPRRFSHVYMRVHVNGQWIGLDGTQPHSVPGWEPPRFFRRKEWGNMVSHSRALGMGNYRAVRRNPATGLGVDFSTVWGALAPVVTPLAQAGAQRIAYGQMPPYYSSYGGYGATPYGTQTGPSLFGGGSFAVGSPRGPTQWETLLPWILGAGVLAFVLLKK